ILVAVRAPHRPQSLGLGDVAPERRGEQARRAGEDQALLDEVPTVVTALHGCALHWWMMGAQTSTPGAIVVRLLWQGGGAVVTKKIGRLGDDHDRGSA